MIPAVINIPSPLSVLSDPVTEKAGIRLLIKRDDLTHPHISGNKWRKLKYNLLNAEACGADILISFGGAYSNHLYALAAAGKHYRLQTAGIVRGAELDADSSATLRFCKNQGMQLHFVSREEYREKDAGATVQRLMNFYKSGILLPEGGTNHMALPGVSEMVDECLGQMDGPPDYLVVPAGTGGTAAGILSSGQHVMAFSVLKGGGFLYDEILRMLPKNVHPGKLDLQTGYHFGGYARYTPELSDFIHDFERRFRIPIEHVYTGKMLFGLYDLIKRGYFARGSTLCVIHTGGLQGKTII